MKHILTSALSRIEKAVAGPSTGDFSSGFGQEDFNKLVAFFTKCLKEAPKKLYVNSYHWDAFDMRLILTAEGVRVIIYDNSPIAGETPEHHRLYNETFGTPNEFRKAFAAALRKAKPRIDAAQALINAI